MVETYWIFPTARHRDPFDVRAETKGEAAVIAEERIGHKPYLIIRRPWSDQQEEEWEE